MANFPFQRLQADLAALIASTPPGQRMTSEPELSKQLGVSRATLREAMRTFETQGLIRRRQGSGTYVVGKVPVIDAGLEVLESLDTMARRMNLEIAVSDLQVEQVEANSETATGLDVLDGTRLTRVRRVIRADGRPAAYLIDTLPETILKPDDLPAEFRGSVLDYLIARGDKLGFSRAAISATNAPADVAKPLEIQRDDVLLYFVSHLHDASNRVVDYSVSYFIPGYFHFHVNRRVGESSISSYPIRSTNTTTTELDILMSIGQIRVEFIEPDRLKLTMRLPDEIGVDSYLDYIVNKVTAIEFIYLIYLLVSSGKNKDIAELVTLLEKNLSQVQLEELKKMILREFPFSDSLKLISAHYGSAASFDFLGIGKILEIVKDTVKDLIWRGKYERKMAELEYQDKQAEINKKYLELELLTTNIAKQKIELLEEIGGLKISDRQKRVIVSSIIAPILTVGNQSINHPIIQNRKQ